MSADPGCPAELVAGDSDCGRRLVVVSGICSGTVVCIFMILKTTERCFVSFPSTLIGANRTNSSLSRFTGTGPGGFDTRVTSADGGPEQAW